MKILRLTVIAIFIYSCSTIALTGRRQLNIIPSSQMLPMSASNYQQVLKQSQLSTDMKQTALIKKVGKNIQMAVETYMQNEGLSSQLNGFNWEFNLIKDDKMVNAWCMPGGKVAFYTGILPICKDEKGIAVVMGHEVAHAIANHGSERMSQGMLQQLGGLALAKALEEKPKETQDLYMTAFGAGSNLLGILPFSRLHESEADHMGLIFMAMAGYDPNEAPKFWQRMKAQSGGSPPEFLSTHPSPDTRINDLKAKIPEAMTFYKK